MRITCPSCTAEYEIPGALPPNRKVKCARCGNQWAPTAAMALTDAVPEPVTPPPPQMPVAEPKPPEAPTPSEPIVARGSRSLRRPPPLSLAWVASAAVLVGLAVATYVWREPVMRAWPPSIRVYAAVGLTAHP